MGYPKSTTLGRLADGDVMGGTFGSRVPQLPPAMVNEIETMIRMMGGDRATVIRYRYVGRMTIRDIAEQCDCSKSRTEAELASALSFLEGALFAKATLE